jgi:two-component system chemotaxis response regulator CheY
MRQVEEGVEAVVRVLVVDDSPMIRKIVANSLTPEGFEVVGEAGNGTDAVRLYRELRPDLVTMDVTMPIKDGIEASREIKAFAPEARILLLSAMGDEDLLAQVREIGIDRSLKKPFKGPDLVQAVRGLLGPG